MTERDWRRTESRQRQKLLGVRVSRDELTALSLAAKREKKTLMSFLRDAGLARAQEVLGEEAPADGK